jgi:hypothetical protein
MWPFVIGAAAATAARRCDNHSGEGGHLQAVALKATQ